MIKRLIENWLRKRADKKRAKAVARTMQDLLQATARDGSAWAMVRPEESGYSTAVILIGKMMKQEEK